MFKKCFVLGVLLLSVPMSGCVSVRTVNMGPAKSDHIYEKNYQLGTAKTAYVGEEIVKVKDYYVTTQNLSKLRADSDFTLEVFGQNTYRGNKGDQFTILGQSDDELSNYLISVPTMPMIRFCIDKYGAMTDRLVGNMNQILAISPQLQPRDTRFRQVTVQAVDQNAGYVNFEIVFTGIGDKSMNLLYREYTKDNMAREAFYQNLTYPLTTKTIRFKNIQIAVSEITDDHIRYSVTTDGLSQ